MYTHSHPTPPTYFTPYQKGPPPSDTGPPTPPPPMPRPPASHPSRPGYVDVDDIYFTLLNNRGGVAGIPRSQQQQQQRNLRSHSPANSFSTNNTTYGESQQSHLDWVADRVTKMRKSIVASGVSPFTDFPFPDSNDENYNEMNRDRGSSVTRLGEYIRGEEVTGRNSFMEKPKSPALDTLKKLKALQKSCVESMVNLRVVKAQVLGEDENTAHFTPMQHVVDTQAKQIAQLQGKLEKGENIRENVLPAQAEYVKELEKVNAEMEDQLNFLQKTIETDKESYAELIGVHERERMRCERLESKNGMLQNFASQLQMRRYESNEKLVKKLQMSRNLALIFRVFHAIKQSGKEGSDGKVRVAQFLKRWTQASTYKVFLTWKENFEEAKRNRAIVNKFLQRMVRGGLYRCLFAWVTFVSDLKKERRIVKRFRARFLNQEVAKCLATWCDFVDGRRRSRKLAKRVFGRMVYGKLWTAFERWKGAENEEEVRAREIKAVNVLCRILNRQLDLAFSTWVAGVAFEKRCEAVLAKFAARVKLREARAAIVTWVDMVDKRKRVRRLMNRLITGKDGLALREAWAVWSDHCRSRGWEEVQALLTQREEIIEKQAARLQEVEAKLELLHQRGEEMGMASAKRMVQMWQNKCLNNVLQAWKNYAKGQVEDRVKMNRFLSRWTNQCLSKCYDSWKLYAKEEIRCRMVVAKFIKRWKSQCLTKCFLAWAWELREGKKDRIIVERFRKRFLNQCIGRAYNSWISYVNDRKWLRSFVGRVLGGMTGVAFSTWKEETEMRKLKQEEEERQAIILKKFGSRLRLQACMRCLRTWEESVRIRRWLRKLMSRCIGGSYFAMIGDAFALWKRRCEEWERSVLSGSVDDLRARVIYLEGEMVKYGELKRQTCINNVCGRWSDLWMNYVRSAFAMLKQNSYSVSKIEYSRNIMRLCLLRNIRHLEHQALKQWIVYARSKTEKMKKSFATLIHCITRIRNYDLHRGFRKWSDIVNEEVREEAQEKADRKLIVGKASQALFLLERGVAQSRRELGDDSDSDDYDEDEGGGGGGTGLW
ncbi:hypothetical protein TrVE_jg14099 [Triparma verrucosa]|uniref:Uncharacterized protein n=1 Tax=Triparma verrucosa TaxID=1606542 RepID=A0A9W7BQ63_9STRA|nr:hypothetical protein TrVE_jg14099 [Triparma verrucosa]